MWNLERQVEELVSEYIEESEAVFVSASDIGLDSRAGGVYISVNEDFVAVSGGGKSINYYGGFEYIDIDQIITIGHMTFYSGEASRVRDCIEYYIENTENKNNNQEEQGVETC